MAKSNNDMMKALMQGFLVIAGAIVIIGISYLGLMIYGLMIGAFNEQAQAGNIPVDNITLTNMNTSVQAYWTNATLITNSFAIVIGFIGLVILFLIFKPFLKTGSGNGGKKVDF